MDELVILHGPRRNQARKSLAKSLRVVQEVSPYVVVVSEDESTISRFAQCTGSSVWLASTLDSEDPALDSELTPAEHLFVDAWLRRLRPSETKRRIGEGFNWGTHGFKGP